MASVPLNWAGGEHEFLLAIGDLRALQEQRGASPMAISMRLSRGEWELDDPLTVMRLGLVGGGMEKQKAAALVLEMEEIYGAGQLVAPAAALLALSLFRKLQPGEKLGEDPDTEKP